jgi:hypothetical protein
MDEAGSQNSNDVEPDEQLDVHLAAYLLRRNLWLIHGWLSTVQEFAAFPGLPWKWEFPSTVFGDSFDTPPEALLIETNDALASLVRARVVDAAALVELHRSLDMAEEKCGLIAELAVADQRGELCEIYWDAAFDIGQAIEFEASLLRNHNERSEQWRQFGNLMGKALYYFGQEGFDPHDFKEAVSQLMTVGRRLLPPNLIDELDDYYATIFPFELLPGSERYELIELIQNIDGQSIENLRQGVTSEPYYVLDDQKELVIFLGVEIPFERFQTPPRARGGLDVFRVLIQEPGKFLSAKELVRKSRRNFDPGQLYSYVSAFRTVINSTDSRWPDEFRYRSDTRSKLVFIIAIPSRFFCKSA